MSQQQQQLPWRQQSSQLQSQRHSCRHLHSLSTACRYHKPLASQPAAPTQHQAAQQQQSAPVAQQGTDSTLGSHWVTRPIAALEALRHDAPPVSIDRCEPIRGQPALLLSLAQVPESLIGAFDTDERRQAEASICRAVIGQLDAHFLGEKSIDRGTSRSRYVVAFREDPASVACRTELMQQQHVTVNTPQHGTLDLPAYAHSNRVLCEGEVHVVFHNISWDFLIRGGSAAVLCAAGYDSSSFTVSHEYTGRLKSHEAAMHVDRGQLDVMVAIVKPPAYDPCLQQLPRSFRDNNGGAVTIEVSNWAGQDPKRAAQQAGQRQAAPQQQHAPQQHQATAPVASTQAPQQQAAAAASAAPAQQLPLQQQPHIAQALLPERQPAHSQRQSAVPLPDGPAAQQEPTQAVLAQQRPPTPQRHQLAAPAASAQVPLAQAAPVVLARRPAGQQRPASAPTQQQLAVGPATRQATYAQQPPPPQGRRQLASSSEPAPFDEAEQASWEQSEDWLQEEVHYPHWGNRQQKQQRRQQLLADVKAMLAQRAHRQQLLQPQSVLRPYLVMLCKSSQHSWQGCIEYAQLTDADMVGLLGLNKRHGGRAEDDMSTSSGSSNPRRSGKRNRGRPAAAAAQPPDVVMHPAPPLAASAPVASADTPAAAAKARQRKPPSNYWESRQTGSPRDQ